jgi:CRP-like cAMP-binding protein
MMNRLKGKLSSHRRTQIITEIAEDNLPAQIDLFALAPGRRQLQFASFSFDASVWELWPYLSEGASVHFPDEATLSRACSGQYFSRHPAPDPDRWRAIADPLDVPLGRALPEMSADRSSFQRIGRLVYRPMAMFLLGCAVTSVTLSVSVSLSILVPLSAKGLVRRENTLPYIMGANITTFIDTLVAALSPRIPADAAQLYLTDPLPSLDNIGGVMASGGVAEYIYGREARDFGDMGRRLAAQGYVVLVPNPFYRSVHGVVATPGFDFSNPDEPYRILASLPPSSYRRLLSKMEVVRFPRNLSLQEPQKPASHVYFPRNGVASIVTRMTDGRTIEVATIGNEGFVGLSTYLGNSRFPMDTFVQIPGEAVRMDVDAFRREVRADEAFANPIRRYAQALLIQIGQSVACNRVHPIEQRCARWLLMSHDRVLGEEIDLTQEFLAEMLGVRRAGVTQAAGALKRRKLIDYRRGKIRILDRKGLEKAACECYAFIRSEHDRQLG